MPKINLTQGLKEEYERLFNPCRISEQRTGAVDAIVKEILKNRAAYEAVALDLRIPWHFISVIHNMESGLNFSRHLHNGDPLNARTVHNPDGRPKTGSPPFTWETSAKDALMMKGLNAEKDWSISGLLYQIEGYNGWGYRLYHTHVLSPYLWSYSNYYTAVST